MCSDISYFSSAKDAPQLRVGLDMLLVLIPQKREHFPGDWDPFEIPKCCSYSCFTPFDHELIANHSEMAQSATNG